MTTARNAPTPRALLLTMALAFLPLDVVPAEPVAPTTPPPVPLAAVAATDASHGDADLVFRRIADEAWRWRLAQSPLFATSVGAPGHDDELDRVDAGTRARQRTYAKALLARLAALDPARLSPATRVDLAVFTNQVETELRQDETHDDLFAIRGDFSFLDPLKDLPDAQPLGDEAAYRAYLRRLAAIPRYIAEHEALLREGLATGYVPPRVVLEGRDRPIAAIADLQDPAATPFWRPFEAFPTSVPPTLRPVLRAEARSVITGQVLPAYKRFLAFFRETYLPGARRSTGARDLPDGAAFYRARIRDFTTLELSAEEIHAQGLSEVARIEAEMIQVARETGFTGSLPAFLQSLRADARFQARSPEELLGRASYIAKRVDGLLPRFFGLLPRQPYGVAPVPDDMAPFYTSGRYVPAPKPVGAAGTYWVNVYDLPSRPLYLLPALTLHEAVPGHHLQIALAAEAEGLPAWRRHSQLDAYVEGWALYAEHLGVEMGVYTTPYENFGRLSYEMWRAARLVVDTGLHALGWSREQAQDYLLAHTAMSRHEAQTEVDRYIGWPGQALSYKLGELTIRRLRAEAEAALGPRFDLRAFHDVVLAQGAVPLPVLQAQVRAWVATH